MQLLPPEMTTLRGVPGQAIIDAESEGEDLKQVKESPHRKSRPKIPGVSIGVDVMLDSKDVAHASRRHLDMDKYAEIKEELVDIAGELDRRDLRDEADMVTRVLARIVEAEGMPRTATPIEADGDPDPDAMMELANKLDERGRFEEADRVTAAAYQVAMRREAQRQGAGFGEQIGFGIDQAGQGMKNWFNRGYQGAQQAVQQGQQAVGETVQGLGQMGQEGVQAAEQAAQQAARAAQEQALAIGKSAQEAMQAGQQAYQRAKQQAGQVAIDAAKAPGRAFKNYYNWSNAPAAGQQGAGGAKEMLQQGIGPIDIQLGQLRQQGVPDTDPRIVRLQNTKRQMGGYVGQAGQL